MENPDQTRFLQYLQDPGAGRSRFAPSSAVATNVIPPDSSELSTTQWLLWNHLPAQAMTVQSRVRLEQNTEPGNYHETRIVAQGFFQVADLDLNEIWAPVVRIESEWVAFTLATVFDLWIIHIRVGIRSGRPTFPIPNRPGFHVVGRSRPQRL